MTDKPTPTLVIGNTVPGPIFREDVRVGWLQPGGKVWWWGRCRPAALDDLLEDITRRNGEYAIDDRRTTP